jgi:hypothetical protein
LDIIALTASLGLRPESYGAKGDGSTNDTSAFQALAAAINAAGGGTIIFRPGATYIIGRQNLVNNGTYMFRGEDIFRIENCTRRIVIRGNGAKFKLASGLKYGTFNAGGTATSNAMPYTGGEASSPLSVPGAFYFSSNSGGLDFDDFDLDGNAAALNVGGQWSAEATGRQIDCDGLFLQFNTGGIVLKNVTSHHWGRDGGEISATTVFAESGNKIPPNPHFLINCSFTYNCRNNLSIIGGRNIHALNLICAHAGIATLPFFSPPAANCDIEAEHGSIRDVVFDLSMFFDSPNGASFIAASGDSADILLRRCTLDNPANWAGYVGQPGVDLDKCTVFGSFHYIDPADTARAGRFKRVRFTDKDGESITGTNLTITAVSLFDGAGGGAHGTNVDFDQCTFDAHHLSALAGTGCIHKDAVITAANGISLGFCQNNVFRGKTQLFNDFAITALVEQTGVKIVGTVFGNGTQWFSISGTYDPPSLANGASATATLFPPRAKVGQKVDAVFSNDLQGIKIFAWISAAQTASVRFENNTGGTIDLASGTLTVRATDIDAA